jgi:hypothetical protein
MLHSFMSKANCPTSVDHTHLCNNPQPHIEGVVDSYWNQPHLLFISLTKCNCNPCGVCLLPKDKPYLHSKLFMWVNKRWCYSPPGLYWSSAVGKKIRQHSRIRAAFWLLVPKWHHFHISNPLPTMQLQNEFRARRGLEILSATYWLDNTSQYVEKETISQIWRWISILFEKMMVYMLIHRLKKLTASWLNLLNVKCLCFGSVSLLMESA